MLSPSQLTNITEAVVDTARANSFMITSEKDMIKEINLIRSNPKGYISIVQAHIQQLEQQMKTSSFGPSWFQDEIDTAHELVAELENTAPTSTLMPNHNVHLAAEKHGDEGKAKGSLSHQGADGSWPWDRIKREDPTLLQGGENLVGGLENVRESVLALLIDSGIPGRGHRKNILNPNWTFAACHYVGQVADMPNYWVQVFAAPAKQQATQPSQPSTTTINAGGGSGLSKADLATGGSGAPAAEVNTGSVSLADLDSGRNASFLTGREKKMLLEINIIRCNPAGYVPIVEAYINEQEASMKDMISGQDWVKDSIATCHELIEQLKTTPRLSILKPHAGVFKAAKLHGDEGKAKNDLGHQGSDGSWPWDRVLRHAPELNDGNENLVGGPKGVKKSVMLLLVDSGIPNRGHRTTMLNPGWKYCACYEVGQVGNMPNYWVQKYGY